MTADSEGLSILSVGAADLIGRLSSGGGAGTPGIPELSPANVGVNIPAQVAYVAMVLPAPTYADPISAPLLVLSKQLSSGYLYTHIRVQGGAYGGMSQYDPMSGTFAFLSYRDPNIVKTIDIYREALAFISASPIPRDELDKAIIGTIGALDRPMDPSNRGYVAMIRDFTGVTDEYRLKLRNEILDMTPEILHEAARSYFTPRAKSGVIAVYASEENLRKANEVLETKLEVEPLV